MRASISILCVYVYTEARVHKFVKVMHSLSANLTKYKRKKTWKQWTKKKATKYKKNTEDEKKTLNLKQVAAAKKMAAKKN